MDLAKCTCYLNWHRFDFLKPAFPSTWSQKDKSLDKLMVWVFDDLDVCWEYHDGVIDSADIEPTTRLMSWIESSLKRRDVPWVYVKPNMSLTRNGHFHGLAEQHGGKIITCAPWSYYHNGMIHNDRFNLRSRHERAINEKCGIKISFFGSTWCQSRITQIDNAHNTWGNNFSSHSNLNYADYVGAMSKVNALFNPHGVGMRHAVYEGMAIGIPSIIPDISYMHSFVRESNFVVPFDVRLPQISVDQAREMGHRCIDVYEKHMTPQAIIDGVLKQCQQL